MRPLVLVVSEDGRCITGRNFDSHNQWQKPTILKAVTKVVKPLTANEDELAYLAKNSRRVYEDRTRTAKEIKNELERLTENRKKEKRTLRKELEKARKNDKIKVIVAGVVSFIVSYSIIHTRLLEMQAQTWTLFLSAFGCIVAALFIMDGLAEILNNKHDRLKKELTRANKAEANLIKGSEEQDQVIDDNTRFAQSERENEWRHQGYISK